MPHSWWRRKTTIILTSHGPLEAGVKPAQVGRKLRKRRVRGHMDSRQGKEIRRPPMPVLHVEKCACKSRLLSKAHLALPHSGRGAEGIGECPDRLPQDSLYVVLAFLNLAARFLFAA